MLKKNCIHLNQKIMKVFYKNPDEEEEITFGNGNEDTGDDA